MVLWQKVIISVYYLICLKSELINYKLEWFHIILFMKMEISGCHYEPTGRVKTTVPAQATEWKLWLMKFVKYSGQYWQYCKIFLKLKFSNIF